MSKLFEVLSRIEGQSASGSAGLQPAVQQAVSAPRMAPLPAGNESYLSNQWSPGVIQRDPRAAAPPANRMVAMAFDASMVLIALGLFIGVCFVSGSTAVLSLAQNVPWLASMLAGLALLYWLLSAILNHDTPGMHFAGRRAAESYDWPMDEEPIDPRDELDRIPATPQAPRAMSLFKRPIIEELALASRILANEGVLDAYGSVSVRDDSNPNRIFLAGADIGEYDLNGKPAAGDPLSGHPERFIHCEIYRVRPDVMAIVHSRASELIPFGASTVPLLPISQMADFLSQGVPVFESRQVGDVTDALIRARALGQALAETLGDKAATLMRGQGGVVVGPSLHVVVGRAYYMNMNARLQAQAILLGGKVNYLEPGEARTASPANEFEPAWQFWKQKLLM
jgi:ribulose-5-phosphate 4-epimerase/fuculose-1-phosphate aldolase